MEKHTNDRSDRPTLCSECNKIKMVEMDGIYSRCSPSQAWNKGYTLGWFNLLKFPLTLDSAFYFQHLLKLQDKLCVSQQQSGLCTGKMNRDDDCP